MYVHRIKASTTLKKILQFHCISTVWYAYASQLGYVRQKDLYIRSIREYPIRNVELICVEKRVTRGKNFSLVVVLARQLGQQQDRPDMTQVMDVLLEKFTATTKCVVVVPFFHVVAVGEG